MNVAVDPKRHTALPVGRGKPDLEKGTNSCFMHVLIDGVEIPTEILNLNVYTLDQYAAIEIYQRPSQIPVEYTATGFICGAIFFWTKT